MAAESQVVDEVGTVVAEEVAEHPGEAAVVLVAASPEEEEARTLSSSHTDMPGFSSQKARTLCSSLKI